MVLKYWEIRVPELALGAVPRTGAEMKVFEPFRLDPVNHCLWRAEERVLLTPKAFDVLRYLVDHADRLVPQDEILEALWPETYVNPEGIRKYILEIRKVLGDRPDHPTFIETLPKRGYQFIAPVSEERTIARSGVPTVAGGNVVGRDTALAELNDRLEQACGGLRQGIFVTGCASSRQTCPLDRIHLQTTLYAQLPPATGQR